MGTIEAICYRNGGPPDLPLAVMVKLDHYTGPTLHDGTVPITLLRRTWSNSGVQCSRLQLPLKLAWAVTIHKSQGLTLDKVVVDVGKKKILLWTHICHLLQSLSHNRPSVYSTIHFPALDLSLQQPASL